MAGYRKGVWLSAWAAALRKAGALRGLGSWAGPPELRGSGGAIKQEMVNESSTTSLNCPHRNKSRVGANSAGSKPKSWQEGRATRLDACQILHNRPIHLMVVAMGVS